MLFTESESQQFQAKKRSPAAWQRRPDGRQCILVVEDDSLLRRLNTESLIYSGYHVDAADSGATAWAALQVNRYDLVITDNNMPKVTGLELLGKMHAAGMKLPVIMATGTFPASEFAKSPWLHPTSMLLKPYSLDDMLRTVKDVLPSRNQDATGPVAATR